MNGSVTLEQLENDYWPEREYPSRLVALCHQYRKVPLSTLTVEQFRLLISQHIGLPYLVPLALQLLSENILAEGDLYEGDLLSSVLKLPTTFWQQHPALAKQFEGLKATNEELVSRFS